MVHRAFLLTPTYKNEQLGNTKWRTQADRFFGYCA
jgi:hypothetical protein